MSTRHDAGPDPGPDPGHADQYDGPATLIIGETEVAAEVRLRGHLEPIDGRFHWWGRISASPELAELATSGDSALLRTPGGHAEGRLSDVDPWGRFRITGTGRPPF